MVVNNTCLPQTLAFRYVQQRAIKHGSARRAEAEPWRAGPRRLSELLKLPSSESRTFLRGRHLDLSEQEHPVAR